MNKVTLTAEEAQWFSRNVLKMITTLEAQGKNDPKILERATYKTLNSLQDTAEEAKTLVGEGFLVELMLSRKQKLIVKELILSVNKTLTDRIIPEYKRRGGHEKYVEMGEAKSKQLAAMARKFR